MEFGIGVSSLVCCRTQLCSKSERSLHHMPRWDRINPRGSGNHRGVSPLLLPMLRWAVGSRQVMRGYGRAFGSLRCCNASVRFCGLWLMIWNMFSVLVRVQGVFGLELFIRIVFRISLRNRLILGFMAILPVLIEGFRRRMNGLLYLLLFYGLFGRKGAVGSLAPTMLGQEIWWLLPHVCGMSVLPWLMRVLSGGGSVGVRRAGRVHWQHPGRGRMKVNADGSVRGPLHVASIGGVLRDSTGAWIYGFGRCVGCCSVLMVELWAAYESLKHAWDYGCRFVDFETDNTMVAGILNMRTDVLSENGLVQRLRDLMGHDWDSSVRYVPRDANMVADKMASLAHDWSFCGKTWFRPPPEVEVLVLDDITHSS
ncbi:hypothetical protein HRI_004109600 [Hibiscus trionum]|uniref:RNase H type-1 domain-containing protein n=1 Tax=Hibiscus trionum TaxID=183268 RepID=A0A9W7MJL3_HIBTR|nr:hypothetical protein HRI_004109600 [Hibiscus trionum]